MRSPQMYDAVVEAAVGQVMAQAGLGRPGADVVRRSRASATGAANPRLGGGVASFEGIDVQDRLGSRTCQPWSSRASSTPPRRRSSWPESPGACPAGYQVLPGTPHMQTLERPELVAAALNEFLPAGALDNVET